MAIRFFLFWAVLLVASRPSALAQEPEKEGTTFWENIDTLRAATFDNGKVRFTPFLAPSSSPELGFTVSAGGLITFKVQKDNALLERSSMPFSVGYSTNGSLIISARPTIYWRNDKARIVGEIWYKDLPDNYWGAGYDNGRNQVKSDSTTAYQRRWWRFYQKVIFRAKSNFYIGPAIDFNKTIATDLNPVMMMDAKLLETDSTIRNSGIGVTFQYDSRDIGVNAYKGWFLDFTYIHYGRFLGGKNIFGVIELDYRQYKQLGQKRRVVAWQVKHRSVYNGAPWSDLSHLGTPNDLRGYTWGRYRDESMLFGIVEYRHMFGQPKEGKLSIWQRFGFVTWVGLGTLGRDITEYTNWLPNYGVGLRFETQTRMNVRIDYGRGIDSGALYVTFNEAF